MKPSKSKIFTNGIITSNPVFRLVLGTCPTLAVTTSAFNGLGMGLAASGDTVRVVFLDSETPNGQRIS